MKMTISQKIIAHHSGKDYVEPGEFVFADVDLALANDITGPVAISEFKKAGGSRVFDKDKIALVPDHFAPCKDIKSAELCRALREFAKEQNITNYFEVGRMGIEHALLPEKGLVMPGDLVIGADSHTCTYGALGAFSTGVGSTDLAFAMITGKCWLKVPESMRFEYVGRPRPYVTGKDLILYTIGDIGVDGALYKSMEFTGEALKYLSMDERFTMTNMAVEAGAKNGIMEPDERAIEYARERGKREFKIFKSDEGAPYAEVRTYDVSLINPQVAKPHSPDNVADVYEVAGIAIDQVVIGSCTNGRLEDMRMAAEILKGRRVHPEVRLIVIPATQEVSLRMLKEGITEVFLEAGAVVSTPTCGPCLGGHMGILAKGEKAVATTNRNFVGRMGHPESEVYLSNPAVAAASAVLGRIAHPEEVVKI